MPFQRLCIFEVNKLFFREKHNVLELFHQERKQGMSAVI